MRFVPGVLPVIKHIFHKTTVKIFTTTSSNPTRGWTQPMSVSGVTPMYVFVSTGTQYQRHHYHFIITSSFKKLGAWPTFKGRGCDPVSPPQSRTAYEYHTLLTAVCRSSVNSHFVEIIVSCTNTNKYS